VCVFLIIGRRKRRRTRRRRRRRRKKEGKERRIILYLVCVALFPSLHSTRRPYRRTEENTTRYPFHKPFPIVFKPFLAVLLCFCFFCFSLFSQTNRKLVVLCSVGEGFPVVLGPPLLLVGFLPYDSKRAD
jgi:hypothetical protein